ncbi:23S rRNA (uracil(1939)-C(5))-methyltransferase RlmD [Marinomonas epiphytica]
MRRDNTARKKKPQPRLGPVKLFDVDGLTHDAKGVSRSQGKVTFVEGALPGERVEANITKTGRRFDEAVVKRIVQASPSRVSPPCQHFQECGGCRFQHLASPQQLEAKSTWLQGQLRKVYDGSLEVLSDQFYQYRRRARISIQSKKGQLKMGFRASSSQNIVSITQCHVLTTALQEVLHGLYEKLKTVKWAANVGHIELLEDQLGVSVLFRLTGSMEQPEQSSFEVWCEQQGWQLYWQHSHEQKAIVAHQQLRSYSLEGLTLHYHPQDFVQINAAMNDKMVAQALEWLQPSQSDVVLDLFCGVGNFSLPLAKKAGKVIGVELQQTMVEAAQKNADSNRLTNASFVTADLTQPISKTFIKLGVTKVLLDPPRAGAFECLDTLIKMAPQQILYVSCNASTLARDAEYLVAKGYKVVKAGLMDMFPQTSHVETMMLLHKT